MMNMKSILIVEDESEYLTMIHECLMEDFSHIDKATTLAQAYLFLDKRKYDCLLVDINLPDGNGANIIKYCKDNDPASNKVTPVVIMSGLIGEDFVAKFGDRFAGILPKPFDKTDLIAKLLVAIGKRSGLKKVVKSLDLFSEKEELRKSVAPEQPKKTASKINKSVSIELESGESFDVLTYDPDVSAPFKLKNIDQRVSKQLDKIKKNKSLKAVFSKLTYDSADPHLVKHIGLLINITSGIAKEMEWGSDQTLEKFVLASYLHDIALGDNTKLAKITAFDNMDSFDLSPTEKELLKFHPLASAKLLEHKSDIPQDVITIIQQHHELPDGDGFPNGHDHKRIIPLSSIFIVSHWLADMILADKSWTMELFVKNHTGLAKGPHFRKVFKVLENMK